MGEEFPRHGGMFPLLCSGWKGSLERDKTTHEISFFSFLRCVQLYPKNFTACHRGTTQACISCPLSKDTQRGSQFTQSEDTGSWLQGGRVLLMAPCDRCSDRCPLGDTIQGNRKRKVRTLCCPPQRGTHAYARHHLRTQST